MKYVFLIVLLTNIIFFLWEFNSPRLHTAQSTNTQSKQKLKQIFLLSEVAKQTETSTVILNSKKNETPPAIIVSELQTILNTVPKPSFGKAINSTIIQPNQTIEPIAINKTEIASQNKSIPLKITFCYEIGPFQDENELDQWLVSNKNTISSSRQIEKSTTADPKYLVYSPATGNIEQSKENIQKYQKMGINDVWLFRKGELESAISFGLFSEENRAIELQNKLSEKGLDAKILQSDMTTSPLYLQIFTEKERLKSIFNTNKKQAINDCENS